MLRSRRGGCVQRRCRSMRTAGLELQQATQVKRLAIAGFRREDGPIQCLGLGMACGALMLDRRQQHVDGTWHALTIAWLRKRRMKTVAFSGAAARVALGRRAPRLAPEAEQRCPPSSSASFA